MRFLRQLINRKPAQLPDNKQLKLNSPSQKTGDYFEGQAQQKLETKGLVLIAKNYRCKLGEIDLIMQDGEELVFIEVRYRNHSAFGGASESITKHKIRRVIRAANQFLTNNDLHDKFPCRFDIVTFENEKFHWIKNAFSS